MNILTPSPTPPICNINSGSPIRASQPDAPIHRYLSGINSAGDYTTNNTNQKRLISQTLSADYSDTATFQPVRDTLAEMGGGNG